MVGFVRSGVESTLVQGRELVANLAEARRQVAPTPYDVIDRCELMELRRYHRPDAAWSGRERAARAVLLVPPLMARSFVFDLHRRRSMVSHLLDAGLDVFLVDWGEPGRDELGLRIEDYVLRWLPRAIARTHEVAQSPVGLVGYCLGGLFGLWHLGLEPDAPVDRLAVIASPVDAHKMGPLMDLARFGAPMADVVGRVIGNVPGPLSSAVFQLTSPVRNVTRWFDLWGHADDLAHLEEFAAMNAWMGNFAALPRGIFVQLAEDFLRDNASFRGELRLQGRRVDLRRIAIPIMAIAGESDVVVAPPAVHAIADAVSSSDVRCSMAPGGHAGVLAGSHSPDRVWTPIGAFMREASARAA